MAKQQALITQAVRLCDHLCEESMYKKNTDGEHIAQIKETDIKELRHLLMCLENQMK